MLNYKFILSLLITFFFCTQVFSKTIFVKKTIEWQNPQIISISNNQTVKSLFFKNASFNSSSGSLPLYFEKFQLNYSHSGVTLKINKMVFTPCSEEERNMLTNLIFKNDSISFQTNLFFERKQPYISISLIPVRKNSITGLFEKLVSFEIEISEPDQPPDLKKGGARSYTDHSVLSKGTWYKMSVTSTGIYKITYSDLSNMGINVNSIDPNHIRIFGNGAGMLPEMNIGVKNDDLVENAIFVSGEEDGKFNENDFILFYGEGPTKWTYSESDKQFHHSTNLYSNETFYFLTIDQSLGKRIGTEASITELPTDTVTKFMDYTFHELDQYNMNKSGREWYGESFDIKTSYDFDFLFPGLDLSSKVYLKTSVIARSDVRSSFTLNANGSTMKIYIDGLNLENAEGDFAIPSSGTMNFPVATSSIKLNFTYNKPNNNSTAWLNDFELNMVKILNLNGNQLLFRNPLTVGTNRICAYILSNANTSVKIWDVTDHFNIKQIEGNLKESLFSFTMQSDALREFVALNGSSFPSPSFEGKVDNQDLHGIGSTDFIIICHPDFISEATRLAQIHKENDSLTSVIVTPQQIYNEFSSGAQDVSAIRDFVKMLYDRATTPDEIPKYLLLFGDGSYNYKSTQNNTNLIPTYQSSASLNSISTFTSDDFFGLLDDGEGNYSNGTIDIGIGRLPVQTNSQAKIIVDKISRYMTSPETETNSSNCNSSSTSNSGEWKNSVCFVADDEEKNSFLNSAEHVSTYVESINKNLNIDKIYFDAFKQISTSAGQRYPDVTSAINKRIDNGTLIINYIGHSGELGWALERVLKISDINGWTNFNKLPLFITESCEFSRFDDPEQTSAGEYVLLNPNGGGIGLLTTTRASYLDVTLNKYFYDYAFNKTTNPSNKLGDLIRLSKGNFFSSDVNVRKFILLGDPALSLAIPNNKVVTTIINSDSVTQKTDTLKAFSKITVSGYIEDANGNIKTNYNGVLYPTVYDKYSTISSLGNDPTSTVQKFNIQNNVLYKGKATIKDGLFTFSFIVPKDISYQYGFGKISYYASSVKTGSATGYLNKIIIGGSTNNFVEDTSGSQIRMFMNDTLFHSGETTNQSPVLLAYIKDENGINTTGNGIGHDIIGILDGNTEESMVMNDYYQTDLNSYTSGILKFPFTNLSEGKHSITLKIWDTYNNSSTATLEFEVVLSDKLLLTNIQNFPNPFSGETTFHLEHNCPCNILEAEINIYNMLGQKVKTIKENILSEGYDSNSIHWDGTGDGGSRLATGIYVYHCKIKTENNKHAEKSGKLIIQNF